MINCIQIVCNVSGAEGHAQSLRGYGPSEITRSCQRSKSYPVGGPVWDRSPEKPEVDESLNPVNARIAGFDVNAI